MRSHPILTFMLAFALLRTALADPAPVPPSLTLPVVARPYPTMQPTRAAPAKHLYVADVRALDRDQQLLLASLQGIVNRTTPRIYLIWSDDDQFWLDEMQRKRQTGAPILVDDPLSLVATFRGSIAGAVIPDPSVYLSPCIAVDISGLDNALIATPTLAASLGLPITIDLRGMFADDAAALHYARTILLPRMNPYLCLCLDPTLLGSQVDDIIAANGSCFWVTGPNEQNMPGANEAAELDEIEKTFAEMPLGTVVRGFWWHGDGMGLDEGPGVSLASTYGKITTVSDYVANFSVTSGIRIGKLKQKRQPSAPLLDPAKVYLAITVSDGDNLCTWRRYFRPYFTDPLHGTFPIAWGMGPTLIDLAPNEAQWFYAHAAPTDEFICDVSGVGYVYPPQFGDVLTDQDAALSQFYQWTTSYMDRLDMRTVRLMGIDPPTIAKVGADLPKVPFLMPDYGWQGEGDAYANYTYTLPTGQPVFRAITSSSGPDDMANQIRRRVGNARPAFINVFVINWNLKLSDMRQMLDNLGPEYIPVTPSQLNTLYLQANATPK